MSVPGNAIDFKAAGGAAISGGIAVSGDANWSASGGDNATALHSGEALVQKVTVVIGGSIVMQSAQTDGPGNGGEKEPRGPLGRAAQEYPLGEFIFPRVGSINSPRNRVGPADFSRKASAL